MKKAIVWILGLLILVAYFSGTWLTGGMAHARVEQFTDFVTRESSGMLQLVEHKSTRGFFRSVEDVTFSFDYPLANALLGNKSALRFTIHNVILYGPLPGLRTVGIARVESTLVLDESTRKTLKEVLGTDRPVEIFVTFGFGGTTSLDVNSPAMTVHLPDDASTIDWKGMKSHMEFSNDFSAFTTSGSIPGISAKSKDGSFVEMNSLNIQSKFRSAFESLYVGNGSVAIDAIDASTPGSSKGKMHVKNAGYSVNASADGDYYNLGIKVGAARFESTPPPLKDMHFDFSMNHLHGPTLASMYKYFQTVNTKARQTGFSGTPDGPGAAPITPEDIAKLQSDAGTLLQHSPELILEHLSFATDQGDLKITGHLKFNDVTEEDIKKIDATQLLNKLTVTADASIAQALVDHWPIDAVRDVKEQAAEFERQGYFTRKGDRLEAHIEFAHGALSVNGKPMGK